MGWNDNVHDGIVHEECLCINVLTNQADTESLNASDRNSPWETEDAVRAHLV